VMRFGSSVAMMNIVSIELVERREVRLREEKAIRSALLLSTLRWKWVMEVARHEIRLHFENERRGETGRG